MSLLIQQEKGPQINNKIQTTLNLFKTALYRKGLLDSNSIERTKKGQIHIVKIFDLFQDYKVLLNFSIKQQKTVFKSSLLKKQSVFLFYDKKIKNIYWRFLQKYSSKKQIIALLSRQGQLSTKKSIFLHEINQKIQTLKQTNQKLQQLIVLIRDFIEESFLFYRNIIVKIQQNISQISKVKPQYIQKQIHCNNLCNYSFFPTFQIYQQNHNLFKQFHNQHYPKSKKYHHKDEFLELVQKFNFIYTQDHTHLLQSIKKSFLDLKNFDIQKIYEDLAAFKQEHIQDKPTQSCTLLQKKLHKQWKTYVTNLQINLFKKDKHLKQQIYNEIEILNPNKVIWQKFDFTALSQLKIAKVKYKNKTLQSIVQEEQQQSMFQAPQFYQSIVILKHQPLKISQCSQKNRVQSQIKWQKSIIKQCFKKQSCFYIPKFFFTNQNLFNLSSKQRPVQFLISEYMRRGTLKDWLYQNSDYSSIFTKINIVLYFLYGVTFLHSKKVYHMDLKPVNILMDKNLIPKITDFGSAFNKEVYEKMRRQKIQYYLSFSIPYTAPEIFMKSKKPSINSKCDMFSIGQIIFEILNNYSIFTQSNQRLEMMYKKIGQIIQIEDPSYADNKTRQKKNQIEMKLRNFSKEYISKRLYFCAQMFEEDKSQINIRLINLIFRCLSCYQQKRPYLGFLIIAIKQMFQLFLDYYS